MSAVKKWALGGLVGCVAGMFVFGTVLITGHMPGSNVLGIISYVVAVLGVFGVAVRVPDWNNPPK